MGGMAVLYLLPDDGYCIRVHTTYKTGTNGQLEDVSGWVLGPLQTAEQHKNRTVLRLAARDDLGCVTRGHIFF